MRLKIENENKDRGASKYTREDTKINILRSGRNVC